MPREWDDFDAEERDPSGSDEVTEQTRRAHAWARLSFAQQFGHAGWRWAVGGARLRIRAWGYVVEVRGQASATAHGKQGALPAHWEQLREIGWPVLVVFVDGGQVQSIWLDDPSRPGPVTNVDKDTAHRRVGWPVGVLDRATREEFVWPNGPPEFPEPTQPGLFDMTGG